MLNPFQRSTLKINRDRFVKKEIPKINIVDYYEDITCNSTKPSGDARISLCPFHEDHVPSFALYEDTSSYYCFSCGVHGDALSLIMKLEGVTFKEALEIAKKYER